MPSVATGRDRLAFVRRLWDVDLYRLEAGGEPAPLVASTFGEWFPQFSPDGQRITFQSDRTEGIWLADADGSNPRRLTRGPGRGQWSPRWSPDGLWIAFHSAPEDGPGDVWTIGTDGSDLRQVTQAPSGDAMPSWSRDGRFLYFVSDRTGRSGIWRAPAVGGTEEQVTREGGDAPFESFDGTTLYYKRSEGDGALLGRPTSGGPERVVVPCVHAQAYAVGPLGIYYVECPSQEGPYRRVLRHLDPATGRDRVFGTFDSSWVAGITVSPDGQTVVFGSSKEGQDLMMIEDFR
jgi:Tol biopolymer transport system component